MNLLTIILFFVCSYGLGYSVTYFINPQKEFFEKHIMRIGIGLGVFCLLASILNMFHIPLDWRIFLFSSIAVPIYSFFKNRKIKQNQENKTLKRLNFRITKSNLYSLIAILIFLLSFFIYLKGSFSYPYLEDTDPWGHATSVTYVSKEKTDFDPYPDAKPPTFSYIDPYPPSYDNIMAILLQTNNSVYWTLKFFNALIISLGLLFFYFFAKLFTKDRKKALFSMFVLSAIPCFLSHFIWAHALVVTLIFPMLYCLEKIKQNKKYFYPAAITVSAIALTHPVQAIKIGIMVLIYIAVLFAYSKKQHALKALYASLCGVFLSLSWWVPMLIRRGGIRKTAEIFFKPGRGVSSIFSSSAGTATRAYSVKDFVIAKTTNMINNPVGIGFVLSFIVIIAIIYVFVRNKKTIKKECWITTALIWLLFTFLFVNSKTFNLPFGLAAFRVWMLMAIPISLLSSLVLDVIDDKKGVKALLIVLIFLSILAFFIDMSFPLRFLYCISAIILSVKFLLTKEVNKKIIIAVIVFGILLTSGYQKYKVNTALWPTDRFTSYDEAYEYAKWFGSIPKGANVFLYSGGDYIVIGFDGFSCYWCEDVKQFRKRIPNEKPDELYGFLKSRRYNYLIISHRDYYRLMNKFNMTKEDIDKKLSEIINSNFFNLAYKGKTMLVFRI